MKNFNLETLLRDNMTGISVLYRDDDYNTNIKGIVENVTIEEDDWYTYQFGGELIAQIRVTENGIFAGTDILKNETCIISLEDAHKKGTITIL